MSRIEQLLQARQELGYRNSTNDLLVCDETVVGPLATSQENTIRITLAGENPCFSPLPQFSVRSRFAQIGLHMNGLHSNGDNTYLGHLVNFGPRPVKIGQDMPLGTLYDPSIATRDEDLLQAVKQSVDVSGNNFVLADTKGRIQWKPGQRPCRTDTYSLLGIKVNQDEFYEVDPDGGPIAMPLNGDLRKAVSQFLRPVHGDAANHPFAVTSTVPVSLGDLYLTLITHHYEPLYHLSSVVIKPGSNWQSTNGDNSGIRCEYFSLPGLPVQRKELPDYVFFSVHSGQK